MKRIFTNKLFFILFPVILFLIFLFVVLITELSPEAEPVAPIGLVEQQTFEQEFSEVKDAIESDHSAKETDNPSSLESLPDISISFSQSDYSENASMIHDQTMSMEEEIESSIRSGEEALSQFEFPSEEELEIEKPEPITEFSIPDVHMDTSIPSLPTLK